MSIETMLSLLTIVLVTLIRRSVAIEITAIVNTTTGPVQGVICTSVFSANYSSFKGIRYAEPPVGYLRFRPPVPIEPWTEVLNATADGHQCPQYNGTSSKVDGSEDCLFLNVYSPVTNLSKTPTKLKAVMVWIYGGAFVSGSSATKNNLPDFLIKRDVVVVALNYRLGALGFLNLGHPNATGNAGLKDQNLGLKWVQANIEKFGGNPKNVTIFGESAGAVSVGFQVLSEKSAGLFHGAISMSGTPLVPWGFTRRADAISQAETLARLLGAFPWTKPRYLQSLYAATPEQLVINALLINPVTPFTPTLEDPSVTSDPFISDCSIIKYQSGNFNKVPQMLGFMDQETVTFLNYFSEFFALLDQANGLNGLVAAKTIQQGVSKVALQAQSDAEAVMNILGQVELEATGSDYLVGSVSNAVLETAVNITTDSLFKLEIDQTQRLLVDHIGDVPVYYYDITFDYPRSRHSTESKHPLYGPGHADDIAYVFYIPGNHYNLSMSDPMGRTIYRISTMWTNFAKYGDPTPHWVDENPLNVTWPPSGKSGQALQIGNELKVVPRPINVATYILESILTPLAPQLNDC